MAKLFLASEYEISNIVDGDLGTDVIRTDWYHRRFIAEVNGLLNERVNIEIPFMLPRDQYDDSIIPGGCVIVEDPNIVESILEHLGVDANADYIFSVLSGKYCRAGNDYPTRFLLSVPERSRDIILSATWAKDAPSPANLATDEICERKVVESASFEDTGYGYCSATWVIRSKSPLGKLLVTEAQRSYDARLCAGVEHFKGYKEKCVESRDELWDKLSAIPHDATGKESHRLTCHDYYVHAEWNTASGATSDDYYFYTEVGVGSVIDLAKSWSKDDSNFTLVRAF